MVAPKEVVEEARWLRRLMHRSVPLNNQRAATIFLAEGHYLALVRKLRTVHAERWYRVMEHIDTLMPDFKLPDPCQGGASVWLECPEGVDGRELYREAKEHGVLFEIGDPFVRPDQAGRFLRLGLSLIETDAIVPGMRVLGEVTQRLLDRGPIETDPLDQSQPDNPV